MQYIKICISQDRCNIQTKKESYSKWKWVLVHYDDIIHQRLDILFLLFSHCYKWHRNTCNHFAFVLVVLIIQWYFRERWWEQFMWVQRPAVWVVHLRSWTGTSWVHHRVWVHHTGENNVFNSPELMLSQVSHCLLSSITFYIVYFSEIAWWILWKFLFVTIREFKFKKFQILLPINLKGHRPESWCVRSQLMQYQVCPKQLDWKSNMAAILENTVNILSHWV